MAARKRKRKPKPAEAFIDPSLASFKKVPQNILDADKVAEKIVGKPIPMKRKNGYKLRSAITNYQNALKRRKELQYHINRNTTSLKQAHSELTKLVKKFGIEINQ
jgi:RNase H-fold protein (predicted Holliday junction resolvase)